MNTFKKGLLASAGLIMLALTFAFTDHGRAVAQGVGEVEPPCIRLCDDTPIPITARIPIPVTGEVAIRGEVNVVTPSRERPLFVQVVGPHASDIVQHEFHVTVPKYQVKGSASFTVPNDKIGSYLLTYASGILEGRYFINQAWPTVRLKMNNNFEVVLPLDFVSAPGGIAKWDVGGNALALPVWPGSTLTVEVQNFNTAGIDLVLGVSMH